MKNKMSKGLTLVFVTILGSLGHLYAQQVLTLEECINQALKANFDLKIAKNNVTISHINNNSGTAGGLPTVNAGGSENETLTEFSQALSNGTSIERSGVRGSQQSANITGSWLVFNGFYVQATRKRLAELEKQNQSILLSQIQNTIAAVSTKYVELVRQQNYIKTIEKNLAITNQRLQLVESRKAIGMANDADLFQSQLDVSQANQDLSSQKLLLRQAKMDLRQLTSSQADTQFVVVDSIAFGKPLVLDSILNYIQTHPQILSAQYLVRINELNEQQIAAQRYPSLRINAGYNYNRNQSSAGLQLYNQTYGPAAGFNFSIPIYNGGIYKTQQQAQQINTLNAKIQQENLSLSFYNGATKAFEAYQTQLRMIETERKNVELSKKVLDLTIKRFEANQATILDVRVAQKSFEDASYRLTNLRYLAKTAEIELNRLSNRLVY